MARKRRGEKGGDDGSDRWLGTYGDAITLLMAFFVMLYAMSEVDAEKFRAFLAGLQMFGNENQAASLLPEGAAILEEDGLDPGEPENIPTDAQNPPEPPVSQQQPQVIEPAPAPVMASQAARKQLKEIKQEVIEALQAAGVPNVASYRFDQRGLVVSITADDVLFATGSTAISDKGERVITAVADALRPFPNDILVEGHTDNVPLTRAGYSNWNLSTDRAVAVLRMMWKDLGIKQRRLGAAGYGEFRPLVPNNSPANRSKNRRVDVLIVAEGATDG